MRKETIRTPGVRIKITSKSNLHEGQKGRVVRDYDNTILIQAENTRHKYAYKSRVGQNDQGLDPKSYLPGKFFMVSPHSVVQIAED